MSATGLAAFDSTLHTTNAWLADIQNAQAGRIDMPRTMHCVRCCMRCAID